MQVFIWDSKETSELSVSATPLRGYFGIRELSDVVDVSDVEKYCG